MKAKRKSSRSPASAKDLARGISIVPGQARSPVVSIEYFSADRRTILVSVETLTKYSCVDGGLYDEGIQQSAQILLHRGDMTLRSDRRYKGPTIVSVRLPDFVATDWWSFIDSTKYGARLALVARPARVAVRERWIGDVRVRTEK